MLSPLSPLLLGLLMTAHAPVRRSARTTTLMQSDWYHLQSSESGSMPGGQNCPIMTRNLRLDARRGAARVGT